MQQLNTAYRLTTNQQLEVKKSLVRWQMINEQGVWPKSTPGTAPPWMATRIRQQLNMAYHLTANQWLEVKKSLVRWQMINN